MASSALWKLRRIAPRAKRVYDRRANESAAVAAYSSITGLADAFITAYDTSTKYEAKWRKEMGEGKGAIAALVAAIRAWLPRVERDVPGFDASTFADQPAVPDDVIEDGERLVSVIDEHQDKDGKPLSYKAAALGALDPPLKAAQKEWSEAEAADSAYQKVLAEVRTAATAFDAELQAFRRTLAGAFGRSDKDYQKLRAERAAHADADDDPGAPSPAPPA
ncbi:hypothetical protein A7982_12289 [Minicystis rosea]|nr:hypothetical protein A7982_12289 [Minicystis rosea]